MKSEVPLNSLKSLFLKVTQYLQIPSEFYISLHLPPVLCCFPVFFFFHSLVFLLTSLCCCGGCVKTPLFSPRRAVSSFVDQAYFPYCLFLLSFNFLARLRKHNTLHTNGQTRMKHILRTRGVMVCLQSAAFG